MYFLLIIESFFQVIFQVQKILNSLKVLLKGFYRY